MAAKPKEPPIGKLIDKLYSMREERLALQRKVTELEEQESIASASIRLALRDSGLQSGRGNTASATITHKLVAQVDDWPTLWKWIKARDAFDLLQRRVGMEALEERLLKGQKPPIRTERVEKLSLTKVRAKG